MSKNRKQPAAKSTAIKKKTAVKRLSRAGKKGKRTTRSATHRGGVKEGCAAMLLIAEHAGGERDEVGHAVVVGEASLKMSTRKSAVKTTRGQRGVRLHAGVCRTLAAAGHETRMKILVKLLGGPATYQALQRVTKAPAGSLYHHINQLRLAGLILPKQRDLYELTRGGRNLVLAVAAFEPLLKDRRRRPVGR